MKTQHIVCAAIRNKHTGLIVCGARHFDEIMHNTLKAIAGLASDELDGWVDADQGFIDQFGKYLSREEANKIVLQTGQCVPELPNTLFSEDLY